MTRQTSPAAERNREPILAVLRSHLPTAAIVLEIASGTGQHAVHFTTAEPGWLWTPSDPDEQARASIAAWSEQAEVTGVAPPLAVDCLSPASWPTGPYDAVIAVNMIHISPWDATTGLFDLAARVLKPSGLAILYGPYFEADVPPAPSNLAFDESLKARNPAWGIRDRAAVETVAREHGFRLVDRRDMPANNLTLVFAHADGGL